MRFAAVLVALAGCAGAFGAGPGPRSLAYARVAVDAVVACDVAQTTWARDGGRWDRVSRGEDGHHYVIEESNPLLGRHPSEATLVTGLVVAVAVVELAYRSGAPTWFRAAAIGAVGVVEGYTVVDNALAGAGACGLVGTGASAP